MVRGPHRAKQQDVRCTVDRFVDLVIRDLVEPHLTKFVPDVEAVCKEGKDGKHQKEAFDSGVLRAAILDRLAHSYVAPDFWGDELASDVQHSFVRCYSVLAVDEEYKKYKLPLEEIWTLFALLHGFISDDSLSELLVAGSDIKACKEELARRTFDVLSNFRGDVLIPPFHKKMSAHYEHAFFEYKEGGVYKKEGDLKLYEEGSLYQHFKQFEYDVTATHAGIINKEFDYAEREYDVGSYNMLCSIGGKTLVFSSLSEVMSLFEERQESREWAGLKNVFDAFLKTIQKVAVEGMGFVRSTRGSNALCVDKTQAPLCQSLALMGPPSVVGGAVDSFVRSSVTSCLAGAYRMGIPRALGNPVCAAMLARLVTLGTVILMQDQILGDDGQPVFDRSIVDSQLIAAMEDLLRVLHPDLPALSLLMQAGQTSSLLLRNALIERELPPHSVLGAMGGVIVGNVMAQQLVKMVEARVSSQEAVGGQVVREGHARAC